MKVLMGLVALMLLVGCASNQPIKVGSSEDIIDDSVVFKDLSYELIRGDNGVRVKLTQSFTADVKITDRYEQKTTATEGMISDMPLFGLAIAPILVLSDIANGGEGHYTKTDQKVHTDRARSISKPVENGSSVSGYLVLKKVVGEEVYYSRPVSYDLRDSGFSLPVPRHYGGCVIVNFEGVVNTLKQQVPLKIKNKIVC